MKWPGGVERVDRVDSMFGSGRRLHDRLKFVRVSFQTMTGTLKAWVLEVGILYVTVCRRYSSCCTNRPKTEVPVEVKEICGARVEWHLHVALREVKLNRKRVGLLVAHSQLVAFLSDVGTYLPT